jgi:hypothetical protein
MLSDVGQRLLVGFDGTTVTPAVAELIVHYRVANIVLSHKNLECKSSRYVYGS